VNVAMAWATASSSSNRATSRRSSSWWTPRYETLEFRVGDVCSTVDEAVMVAGLVRGLVHVSLNAAQRDVPPPAVRGELVRMAEWQAARFELVERLRGETTSDSGPAG